MPACTSDRESRSPEPFAFEILHREWANKVFGKRSARLLKLFATGRPRSSAAAGSHRRQFIHQLLHRVSIVYVDADSISFGISSTSTSSQSKLALAADRYVIYIGSCTVADSVLYLE